MTHEIPSEVTQEVLAETWDLGFLSGLRAAGVQVTGDLTGITLANPFRPFNYGE